MKKSTLRHLTAQTTREHINNLTLADVESATSSNGVINYRTLVNKCIGRVTTKERAEQRKAYRQGERRNSQRAISWHEFFNLLSAKV